jgi:hypothetical protein
LFFEIALLGENSTPTDFGDEKKHCVHCSSSEVKRFGKDRSGRQRWYCLCCHRTFQWRLASTHRFHWFRLWIVHGYSIGELARLSGKSVATVRRTIAYWLERPPRPSSSCGSIKHIIVDGTFLDHNRGIYAAMDAEDHRIIDGGYNIREGAQDLVAFYQQLLDRGLLPHSATVDGNPQQIKYLRALWPSITLQRCLVHVQRQGLSWCRRTPKRTEAKHLRQLFLQLTDVQTVSQAQRFVQSVYSWERRFASRIESSRNRGWVFSDLLRARSMLLGALPDLFHFVHNPRIVRSTNALEGYFGRLKEHYRRHRGLSPKRRSAYFQWHFHLVPR